MRFISDEQRKAVMARMQLHTTGARRLAMRAHGKVSHAWGSLSPGQRSAVAGAGALAGAILSMRPAVSHIKGGSVKGVLRQWGPHMAMYTVAPAAGAVYQIQKGKTTSEAVESLKRRRATVAGAGATGLGMWFGERAVLHSLPALIPPKLWPESVRKQAAHILVHPNSRSFFIQHGIPLGAAAVGLSYLGKQLVGQRQRKYTKAQFKSITTKGVAGRVAEEMISGGIQMAPVPSPIKVAAKWTEHATSIFGVPTILGTKFGRGLIKRPPKEKR